MQQPEKITKRRRKRGKYGGLTITSLAEACEIPYVTMRKWLRQYFKGQDTEITLKQMFEFRDHVKETKKRDKEASDMSALITETGSYF